MTFLSDLSSPSWPEGCAGPADGAAGREVSTVARRLSVRAAVERKAAASACSLRASTSGRGGTCVGECFVGCSGLGPAPSGAFTSMFTLMSTLSSWFESPVL
eukprot:5053889-Prymnesium_polylepis.1